MSDLKENGETSEAAENFGDIVVREERKLQEAGQEQEEKRARKHKKRTPEERLLRSEKRISWVWGFLFGILACLALFAGMDYVQLQQSDYLTNSNASTASDTLLTNGDEVLEKLQTIQTLIDLYYLYDVDEENSVESLYAALLDSLGDPYSVYYTAEEYADLMESGSGTYYGIGVEVTQSTEKIGRAHV